MAFVSCYLRHLAHHVAFKFQEYEQTLLELPGYIRSVFQTQREVSPKTSSLRPQGTPSCLKGKGNP